MSKVFFILTFLLITSCTTSKKTSVKIPNQTKVDWFTKKSLKKYKKEFYKKDWTKRDTVFVPTLDTTIFK